MIAMDYSEFISHSLNYFFPRDNFAVFSIILLVQQIMLNDMMSIDRLIVQMDPDWQIDKNE